MVATKWTRLGALNAARWPRTCSMSSASVAGRGGVELDGGRHHLPEALVGDPHRHGVGHRGVELQHLLDLFGEHLLAAGVDHDRSPAQEVDGAVGVDGGEVAGDRIADAVDHLERGRGLVGVLVVAERVAPADGEHAHLARPRGDVLVRLGVEHAYLGAQGEVGGVLGRGPARHRGPHPEGLGRREGVDEHQVGMVVQQAPLGLLAPHDPRRHDGEQGRQPPPAGVLFEGAQDGLGEGVAHDGDGVDVVAVDGVEELGRVEVAIGEGDDASAHGHGRHRR